MVQSTLLSWLYSDTCLCPTSECVFYTCALTGALNSFRGSPSSWCLGLGAPEAGESSVLCPPQTSRVLSRRQPIWLSPQEELRASQVVQLQRIRKHKRPGFNPGVRKIPWKRKRQPTPVFLPGKFQGQRSLAGYTVHGVTELDMIEHSTAANSVARSSAQDVNVFFPPTVPNCL